MAVVRTGQELLCAQDRPQALSWLLVQRRMYRRAKRWSSLRLFGFGIVAVGGTMVSVLLPSAVEAVGAAAGLWMFLTGTIFLSRQRHWALPAAAVQDTFDRQVFGLRPSSAVSRAPTPEQVSDILGQSDVLTAARADKLPGWYRLDPRLAGPAAVALAQRANAVYSARLLERHATVWLTGAAVWASAAVALAVGTDMTVQSFLLGVMLPVLPALLDAKNIWADARDAAQDRHRLAEDMRAQLLQRDPSEAQLHLWQDQLHRLRSSGPLVPEFLYWRSRAKNEAAMNAAAAQLSAQILSRQGFTP